MSAGVASRSTGGAPFVLGGVGLCPARAMRGGHGALNQAHAYLAGDAIKMFFGHMACTPTLPSTSWVISRSTATLDSM
jgi:hypothetical protein